MRAFFFNQKIVNVKYFVFCLSLVYAVSGLSQSNTVGLINYKPELSSPGYNLIFPFGQTSVFLIDDCGEVVNEWSDVPGIAPGAATYLLENGDLLKCKVIGPVNNDTIKAGGAGEVIEIRGWDNELKWSYYLNNGKERVHHDAIHMPNGNIMMIAWENKTPAEAIEAGRKSNLITEGAIWPDFLREINPNTNEVVWEWHAWHHLVQDHDSLQQNYGEVAAHPELIDINHIYVTGQADWMHANALDYNAELDVVVISIPHFDEIWVIDHSTTMLEASSHQGGNFEKGGDLLFRWGNPRAYKSGTMADQQLYFQHNAHWIKEEDSPNSPYLGAIAVFNNRVPGNYSSGNIIRPVLNDQKNKFEQDNLGRFLPTDFELNFTYPGDPTKLNAQAVSSFQILPNGNYLIFNGFVGHAYEFTEAGELAWEYVVPVSNGAFVSQGGNASSINFRIKRYALDYPAFVGRDIKPIKYLELNPDTAFCNNILNSTSSEELEQVLIAPNPAFDQLQVDNYGSTPSKYVICDVQGRLVQKGKLETESPINIERLPMGMYTILINGMTARFIKI